MIGAFIIAALLMTAAIWFIAFGIGMFVEADLHDKDHIFVLCVGLTICGAICICFSIVILVTEILNQVGLPQS